MRRLGLATLVTLCLQIAGSVIGYVVVAHQHLGRMQVPPAGVIAWMACAFITGIMSVALVIVYLKHLFRDDTAPASKALWTLLIIFLGPCAMACYWTVYMRRLLYGMA